MEVCPTPSFVVHGNGIARGEMLMIADLGFMTFAPEWLTGNQNLDTSNFMFLWVYLVFFNMLWVFLPLYALYISFIDIGSAFQIRNRFLLAQMEMEMEKEEAATEKVKGKSEEAVTPGTKKGRKRT
jgi:hypothetical protein